MRYRYHMQVGKMTEFISIFPADETGATAIEYGLIASLISVTIIAASSTLGTNSANTFNTVSVSMAAK